nr:efflux RND transporter permease subunit [Rickettsia conorii]
MQRHKTYKQLPNDLPTPPSYCKVNPADAPIFYLSFELILTYKNGNPLFLKNIGKTIDSVANNKIAAWYRDKPGVILAIQKQPDTTNTMEIVDSIKEVLPLLRRQIPEGININIMFDRSISISENR